ncbi:MAG: site-specific DNA-methyltransferase [Ferrovibrio sp.]|nr:site-specific DNA-methyltransferase [Ferrovibrio sp.]
MKPGRWPANLIHDGSDEVLSRFVGTEDKARPGNRYEGADDYSAGSSERVYGEYKGHTRNRIERHFDDAGSAARFFYTAKADAEDRWGSRHPTVKPVDLMAYLCRLVTPPDGVVLDPFAGSGTTGVAALREGFGAVLIEREATFHADIQARLAHYAGEGGHSAAVTQRHADPEKSVIEKLPLFGGKGGA